VECVDGSGFHSLAPDQVFHEVVDPETGARLPDGEAGQLAFTHLIKRGTVLLRYLIGDRVAMEHGPCPHCGRTSPRVASDLTRSGDLVKIRGMLVNLRALKDWLEAHPQADEYQIVIRPENPDDPFSMDALVLRIAPSEPPSDARAAAFAEEAAARLHLRPAIEWAERDALFDPARAVKPMRVVDLRRGG
jgi:phenylacetate-coenzyme A ligase PaaK-like adenylate-forming protein